MGLGHERFDAELGAWASDFRMSESNHRQFYRRWAQLMAAKSYPGMAAHKAKHEDLTKQATKIIDDYRSGRAQLTITLSRFLADWLRTHIDVEDKGMIRHCQGR